MNPLPRICFIGCGLIAARHATILRKLYPAMELCFADVNRSAHDYKARFKGTHSYVSVEEALSSDHFDIAFITTPHAYHAEIAVMAARYRKHIIIEKPVARTTKELQQIIQAVEKYKVRCTVAENYLYKPVIAKIKKSIAAGHIGEVLHADVKKFNRDTISGWRTDPEMMGGGALLEGGVHWINFIVSLADSAPRGVIAVRPVKKYNTNVPYEDTLSLMLTLESGMNINLFHSWRVPNMLKGMALSKIYGTEGVITFESNGLFVLTSGIKKRLSLVNPGDFLGFKAMHRAFVEDFRAGKDWEPSLKRIAMELAIVEAAYRSLGSAKIEKI